MSKRIVICSDGTWNIPDQKDRGEVRPTNVAKMALSIAPEGTDDKIQRVFYDKGVGTGWGLNRWLGGAFGVGISKNIEDAYRFLIENYKDGDEIYLFGFSRGAYAVRSTAGLIRNCGLLKKEYANKYKDAYKLYRRRDNKSHPNSVEAQLFRKAYSHEVRIKFIGVWDTVGALGIPLGGLRFVNKLLGLEFHDVKLSSYVDNAYQALAIDERRKPFLPAIWEKQGHAIHQKLEQVWFAGVHSNVGGGYKDTGLSDIAFLWMKEKAELCGLSFDDTTLKQLDIVIDPDWDGKLRNSKTGLYRLTGDHIRPIGQAKHANESVHSCAVIRYEKKPAYKPENLTEYLSKIQ